MENSTPRTNGNKKKITGDVMTRTENLDLKLARGILEWMAPIVWLCHCPRFKSKTLIFRAMEITRERNEYRGVTYLGFRKKSTLVLCGPANTELRNGYDERRDQSQYCQPHMRGHLSSFTIKSRRTNVWYQNQPTLGVTCPCACRFWRESQQTPKGWHETIHDANGP
jgi:hypothetical protein